MWQVEVIGSDLPCQHIDERTCSTNASGSTTSSTSEANRMGHRNVVGQYTIVRGSGKGVREQAGRQESERSNSSMHERCQITLSTYLTIPSDANIFLLYSPPQHEETVTGAARIRCSLLCKSGAPASAATSEITCASVRASPGLAGQVGQCGHERMVPGDPQVSSLSGFEWC
jgi:hypothetical protein